MASFAKKIIKKSITFDLTGDWYYDKKSGLLKNKFAILDQQKIIERDAK